MGARCITVFLLAALLVGLSGVAPTLADSFEDYAGPGAGPDTLLYLIKPGDSLLKIAKRHRGEARYYCVDELVGELRRANDLSSDLLRIGDRLLIPVRPPEQPPQVRHAVTGGAELRGIYLSAAVCSGSWVFERIDRFVAAGGNAVVFDLKDVDGAISCRTRVPGATYGAGRRAPLIADAEEFIRRLRRRGLYVVARQAVFLDGSLGAARPGLALRDTAGLPWTERGLAWLDPEAEAARRYNLQLMAEAAALGVDEIQLDYLRYPTNGWPGYARQGSSGRADRRAAAIESFVGEAARALRGSGVLLSVDLFGIVGWNRPADRQVTGQDVAALARHVDIICPMVYPSHFGRGYQGFERPADHPEYFVAEATSRFAELAGPEVSIRPWLQAFGWGVRDYEPSYVGRQISAVRQVGGAGWCLWNPACRYNDILAVIGVPRPEIRQPDAPRWRQPVVGPLAAR